MAIKPAGNPLYSVTYGVMYLKKQITPLTACSSCMLFFFH